MLQSDMDSNVRSRKIRHAVIVPLFIVLATACASGDENGGAAIPGGMNEAQVEVSGKEFQPSVVTVPAGTTVKWTNHGGEAHSVISATGLFDGVLVPVNGSFNYTFKQTGNYEYHCDVFDYHVMTGRVVVQ